MLSCMNKQSEELQVNAFMYVSGDDAEDILSVLSLADAQKNKYKDITDAFNAHCVSKKNVIFERARQQLSGNLQICRFNSAKGDD